MSRRSEIFTTPPSLHRVGTGWPPPHAQAPRRDVTTLGNIQSCRYRRPLDFIHLVSGLQRMAEGVEFYIDEADYKC